MFVGKYFKYVINIHQYNKNCDLEVYISENKSNYTKNYLQVFFANSQSNNIQFLI